MTTAQPGQEQTMEIDREFIERLKANPANIARQLAALTEISDWSRNMHRDNFDGYLIAASELLARPTADLGEDGVDAAWLRKRTCDDEINKRYQRIADRIELYREALEATIPALEGQIESLLGSYTNLSGPDKGKVTDPDGLAWIAEFQEPLTKVRAALSITAPPTLEITRPPSDSLQP